MPVHIRNGSEDSRRSWRRGWDDGEPWVKDSVKGGSDG